MYIGLDLGTSPLKAILMDDDQRVLAEHTVALSVQRPHDGWSEQDPASWERAAIDALRAIRQQNDCRGLRGIGLSGHMHGAVLLDKNGDVLRPCMLWNDTRSHAEAAEMDADPRFRAVTGNIVFPGFTAPKVEWVRRHEPEIFDKIAMILLPKDYLRYVLTGEYVAEMSDAAGTSWLDTGARDWSDDLLAACGLSRAQMPRLIEGSAPSGDLRDKLGIELDLPMLVVAGGGGDNAAAAIGAGVVKDGSAFLSLGTSGVLFAANDGYRPDPATAVHTFCHALPGTWHQMGVILAATDALNWLSKLTGQSAAQLTHGLGDLRAPSRTLFLPYLGGERTPHNDSAMRGQFLHLDHATDAQAAARAVMEGVSYAFADCRDALGATGTRIDRALALGGGARSGHWLDMLATVLGFPLDVPEQGEFGAALGAARLGMMAATGAGAEIATQPPVARSHEPDTALAPAFAEGLARYRAAYGALKAL
ncbi:xylulokinase [Pararhodobacter zhoushanensis]|uniref:Xylulose kinase n=1 Tax=Pararhodobacter zhoushanensis TaxID=2479545 RepID=A0ABT3GXF2_9RHOB|nr:xylulokinase [Pararhodobacter zhoushanensis]MCW1932238.1 xylulokinase [Pararhodobacter zhoushanensis]